MKFDEFEFQATIKKFLSSPILDRQWIHSGPVSVYLRRPRLNNAKQIELATIEIMHEFQGQGLSKKALSILERSTDLPIFVENVMNKSFAASLDRRGYQRIYRSHDARMLDIPSFIYPNQK